MADLAKKALNNYWAFIEHIKFKGGIANFDPVHRELAFFLMAPQLPQHILAREGLEGTPKDYGRRALFMHRSGLKSTMLVGYLLWRIYRNPDIRILLNCCDKDLARSFLREITQYLVDGELQDRVWNNRPHIKGPLVPVVPADRKIGRIYDKDMFASIIAQKTVWSQDQIQVIRPGILKEPTVGLSSVKTTETGMHYDIIANDDLVNFDNSDTPDKARKIYRNVSDLISVLDPVREIEVSEGFTETVGREIITTGTPYFDWDYNVNLIAEHEKLNYRMFWRNIYANGIDSSEGYTCPSRFNDETVEEIRNELIQARGAKAWAAQYLLKTIADEDRAFSHDKIVELEDNNIRVEYNGLVSVKVYGTWQQMRTFSAIDPASSTTSRANHSALVIGGLLDNGDLCIVGGFKSRHTPTKLADAAYAIWNSYGTRRAWVETPVGLGTNIIELFNLRKPSNMFVVLEQTIPRGAKNERISYTLEPWLGHDTANKVWICSSLYRKLINEVVTYDITVEDNDDDLLDSLQMLAARLPKRIQSAKGGNQYRPKVDKRYGGFQ